MILQAKQKIVENRVCSIIINFVTMPNHRISIQTGMAVGRLTVGELVRYVQDHPLFLETKPSYLQQGRLRECTCKCGNIRLIAESILASGRIQSCGCLRQEIRAAAANKGISRMVLKEDRKYVTGQIRIEQARLKALQLAPVTTRDEKAISECSERLRGLFRKRGLLTSKSRPD